MYNYSSFPLFLFGLLLVASHIPCSANSTAERQQTLKLVQVIFRHGDRNPSESLGPKYPDDVKDFPRGWSQLTKKGESQALALGQYLRQRYDDLIDPTFNSDQLSVISSETDRTVMTVLAALRGLYPENSDAKCPQSGQLVPLKTINAQIDNFLSYEMPCPRFEESFNKWWPRSEQMKQLDTRSSHLIALMNNATGRKARNWSEARKVISYIKIMMAQNRTLPSWMNEEMLEVFEEYSRTRIAMYTTSPQVKQLRSPTVKKLMEVMLAHKNGEKVKKMNLYSAHDWTLLTTLCVMGLPSDKYPPYTSALMLELHQKNDKADFYVEMYFRNETNGEGLEWKEPPKLEIPKCPSPCSLNRLETNLEFALIHDNEKGCKLMEPSSASTIFSSMECLWTFMTMGLIATKFL